MNTYVIHNAPWWETPYVLLPFCVLAWILLKAHFDRKHKKLWGAYQENAKAVGIVSKDVLTPNENEFFGRLKGALPDYEIIPQVAMGALLDVSLPEGHPEYWPLRKLFSQKIVDFVVCRKGTMEVVTVVELDDRSHDNKKDKDAERDKMLANAGIKTIRWDSRAKPGTEEIRQKVISLDVKKS